ncbi:hypothetical protein DPMN_175369 [Dreissena polymorpha]|uniref:Uncharacterized protein n=1 Tax=Dreissena polymorpha TaxID=45954 RepID=A0A9D4E748_DREPO|nr:hypothetical protein DPMN_175369 [Dreissena polymorpha]
MDSHRGNTKHQEKSDKCKVNTPERTIPTGILLSPNDSEKTSKEGQKGIHGRSCFTGRRSGDQRRTGKSA